MTTRLLVLLVSLTVLPAMGMLWLMNRAAAMETAAGQQQVLEAYRGQLREEFEEGRPEAFDIGDDDRLCMTAELRPC